MSNDYSAGPSRALSQTSRAPSLAPTAPGRDMTARLSSVSSVDGDEAMTTVEEQGESAVFTADELDPGLAEDELDDVRRLGRVLVRERGTPGLLEWEGELVDSLLDKLEQQVRGVELRLVEEGGEWESSGEETLTHRAR